MIPFFFFFQPTEQSIQYNIDYDLTIGDLLIKKKCKSILFKKKKT